MVFKEGMETTLPNSKWITSQISEQVFGSFIQNLVKFTQCQTLPNTTLGAGGLP